MGSAYGRYIIVTFFVLKRRRFYSRSSYRSVNNKSLDCLPPAVKMKLGFFKKWLNLSIIEKYVFKVGYDAFARNDDWNFNIE